MKSKIKDFISAIKQESKETRDAFKLIIQSAKGDIELTDKQKEQIGNQLKDVLKTIGLTAIAVLPGGVIVAALLKIFKQSHLVTPSSFVNEVGEANLQPYKWKETDREGYWVYTKFKTESETQYDVDLKSTNYVDDDLNNLRALEVEFTAKLKNDWTPSAKIVVNKGELYKVMSTITDIIKYYVEKFKAQAITYSPSKKSSEENFGSQRDNLYKAFISKAIPNIKFEKDKESIVAILPNPVNEVGEANLKPYKWEETDREGYYVYTRFTTDSGTQYEVDLESTTYLDDDSNILKALGIEFSAKPKGAEGSSSKIIVNKGEMYKVMSTIADIIKKYIKKSKAQAIMYSPSKKGNEEFGSQRDNLYKAFISKAFPGVKFEQDGEVVAAVLPNSVNEVITDTEVICDNCGWEWPIKDGGNDLYICHKCGHDNNPSLNESKQVGPLYHYTSADGLKGIIQSNRINASEENYLGNELYYISFTRNKNFHKKGSKFGVKTEYRITLDGDKLSNKYKIRPFAYIPGWDIEDSWELDWLDDEPESVKRDFFNTTGDYDEQEERIFFKNENGGIDNIKNYILAVDKVEDIQEGRKKKPDPKKGTGKKPEGSGRRLYTDEDPKDTVHIKFKTKEDIVDTLNKKQFKAKSHARQSQVINLIHQRVRAAYGKAKDPEVKARLKRALDYIESRKEASKEKTQRLNKLKENDPFGLNELAKDFIKEVFEETWKPEEAFLSLSVFMKDNGMNITPLPKIKVIPDDKENASHLLGKTAYYNPADKSITLYTFGRHPKDVLRSFAHEMVHHEQNLNGTLGNIGTTNTNEDGHLEDIEKEAYQKGNIMLRNWEDSIKNV